MCFAANQADEQRLPPDRITVCILVHMYMLDLDTNEVNGFVQDVDARHACVGCITRIGP